MPVKRKRETVEDAETNVQETLEKVSECSICTERFEPLQMLSFGTSCSHSFCLKCLLTYSEGSLVFMDQHEDPTQWHYSEKSKHSCPMCRSGNMSFLGLDVKQPPDLFFQLWKMLEREPKMDKTIVCPYGCPRTDFSHVFTCPERTFPCPYSDHGCQERIHWKAELPSSVAPKSLLDAYLKALLDATVKHLKTTCVYKKRCYMCSDSNRPMSLKDYFFHMGQHRQNRIELERLAKQGRFIVEAMTESHAHRWDTNTDTAVQLRALADEMESVIKEMQLVLHAYKRQGPVHMHGNVDVWESDEE